MLIRLPYQIIFLVFVVLGIYYPALFGVINTVDDWKMIMQLSSQENIAILDLFRPGSGFYYRPLLILTYWGDKIFWDLEPSFMHLENLLIHAANTLLVFFLARKAFRHVAPSASLLPLVGALVFALHPINTESVNWISGRTDPMATLFVLAAFLLLIRAVESEKAIFGLCAAFVFLAGVMSKEMVLFFLPVACFLVWRWPQPEIPPVGGPRLRRITLVLFAGPFVFAGVGYVVQRFLRFGLNDSGLNHLLHNYIYGPFDTVRVSLKVLGFYVKKLFAPFPLNFAITSVSDVYVWVGVLVLTAGIILVWRRSLLGDFLLASVCLILPAIIIALTNIAWTPLAERYLYLPAAFWSIAIVGFLYLAAQNLRIARLGSLLAVVGLMLVAWSTYERNIIWQSNLTLYEDTVRKTPDFPPVRNELAIALMAHGRDSEAQSQWEIAQQMDSSIRVHVVHVNQARNHVREGRLTEARELIEDMLEDSDGTNQMRLQEGARVLEEILRGKPDELERIAAQEALLSVYERIYPLSGDPFVRYRSGQIALFLDRRDIALDYFTEAHIRAPDSAYYKSAALTLSRKLSGNVDQATH